MKNNSNLKRLIKAQTLDKNNQKLEMLKDYN